MLSKCLGQLMTYTMFDDMAIKYMDATLKKYYDGIVFIMLLPKIYSPVGFC